MITRSEKEEVIADFVNWLYSDAQEEVKRRMVTNYVGSESANKTEARIILESVCELIKSDDVIMDNVSVDRIPVQTLDPEITDSYNVTVKINYIERA